MACVDFFIAGAPKCGTTSLHFYLSQHAGIALSDPKEPHFFGTDMGGYQHHAIIDDYHAMFDGIGDRICGEASVFYLMSADALEQVKAYNPSAKIILMLRDPKQMLPSLHAQLVFTQDEDVESFEKAWDLRDARDTGSDADSKRARSMVPLRYGSCAKYGAQLERLYTHFPKEQVHVALFEDFKADAEGCVRDMLKFLEIEDLSASFDYALQNPNTVNRSATLTRILRHPPAWLMRIRKMISGAWISKLRTTLLNANTVAKKRDALPARIYDEIDATYREDVQKLAQILDRDLSHWLGQPKS